LYKIIVNEYGLFSTYEPCIYPGVNIKYFWNSEYNNNGICKCTAKCNGKGKGNGNGNCKKITIAAFQSGNVIITGARDIDQILVTYNFINNIFKNHYLDIKKSDLSEIDNIYFSDSDDENDKLINNKVNKKKIIMIKKSKIKYKQNNLFSATP